MQNERDRYCPGYFYLNRYRVHDNTDYLWADLLVPIMAHVTRKECSLAYVKIIIAFPGIPFNR